MIEPRPRILVIAYAFNPGQGSEPGVGWSWVRMLARCADVWVLTGASEEHYGPALRTLPEAAHIRFVHAPARRWTSGMRTGFRMRVHYVLWQLAALRVARDFVRTQPIDLVWHLTFANVWLGSIGGRLGLPFVLGPVGGGVGMPPGLWPALGVKGLGYELVRTLARTSARYLNPLARVAWARAAVILVQNPETARWLPAKHRKKTRIFQNAVVDAVDSEPVPMPANGASRGDHLRSAVFVGRLTPWKGAALAVRAMSVAPAWRLVICGGGKDRRRIERLVRRLGLDERVEMLGWRTPAEVRSVLEGSDVMLFPSAHDDAPLAVVESLMHGCPVICLDRGGPPLLAGDASIRVSARGRGARVVSRLGDALEAELPSRATARAQGLRYAFDRRAEAVRELVAEIISEVGRPRSRVPR